MREKYNKNNLGYICTHYTLNCQKYAARTDTEDEYINVKNLVNKQMLDKGERMRRFCEAISVSAANVYLYAYLYFRILILICIFICIFVFLSVFVQDKRCLTKENK